MKKSICLMAAAFFAFFLSFGKASATGLSANAQFAGVIQPGCHKVLVWVNYTDDRGQTTVVASGYVFVGPYADPQHTTSPNANCPAETYNGDVITTQVGSTQCLPDVLRQPEVYPQYVKARDQAIQGSK